VLLTLQVRNGIGEVGGVPVDDGSDHQVEARGPNCCSMQASLWSRRSRSRGGHYSGLQPLIGRRIKIDVIREHWAEVVRLVASLDADIVAPSTTLKKLAAYPRLFLGARDRRLLARNLS
jgi:hypothetical protein